MVIVCRTTFTSTKGCMRYDTICRTSSLAHEPRPESQYFPETRRTHYFIEFFINIFEEYKGFKNATQNRSQILIFIMTTNLFLNVSISMGKNHMSKRSLHSSSIISVYNFRIHKQIHGTHFCQINSPDLLFETEKSVKLSPLQKKHTFANFSAAFCLSFIASVTLAQIFFVLITN